MTNNPPHKIDVSDSQLEEINRSLDWHAGTLLPGGRLLGKLERLPDKRAAPHHIPDVRIERLNQIFPLSRKKVLELGCFEGIHTIGLRTFGADVTALDIRPSNVVKTLTRLAYHGYTANVFQADAESLDSSFGTFDLIFHFGVLYHLMQPVEHLRRMSELAEHIYLDTHIARDEKERVSFTVEGDIFEGAYHEEGGWHDPFSGKDARAIWLTYDSLKKALRAAGFEAIAILEEREERNGPRLLLFASRRELPSNVANVPS